MPRFYNPAGDLDFMGGVSPIASLTAVATGTGTALDGITARVNHQMVVNSGAGVSAGSVQFEGSMDNTNWYNLGAAVSTTSATTVFAPVIVQNLMARFVRARIATNITGGTITAVVGSA